MPKFSKDAITLGNYFATEHQFPGVYVLLPTLLPHFDNDPARLDVAINELVEAHCAVVAPNGGSVALTGPGFRHFNVK
jgi:hypothetical protein